MENNVDINLDGTVASVRDFIKNINTLSFHLQGIKNDSEEFSAVLEVLKDNMYALKEVMSGASTAIEEISQRTSDLLQRFADSGPYQESIVKAYESFDIPDNLGELPGNSQETSEENSKERRAKELEAEKKHLDAMMAITKENAIQHSTLALELKEKELEALNAANAKNAEEQAALEEQQLLKQKEVTNAKIKLSQSYMNTIGQAFSGMANLFNSIGEIYKNDAEQNEKTIKKQKNMEIAGATMQMLSGVVSAVSGSMTLGPIVGPIMAGINSAAVIAAGVANIRKIKNTSTSGENSSSPSPTPMASVSAPVLQTEVQTVHNLTSSSEEAHLDNMVKDQKVYILSSDLEANGKRAEVRERETTF